MLKGSPEGKFILLGQILEVVAYRKVCFVAGHHSADGAHIL